MMYYMIGLYSYISLNFVQIYSDKVLLRSNFSQYIIKVALLLGDKELAQLW